MTDTDCYARIQRGRWREDLALQRCSAPVGPRNTWSNVAYLLAGIAAYWYDRDATGIIMGVALACLALGSGLYHALKTPATNKLDLVGMYFVFAALTMHAAAPDHARTALAMAGMAVLLAAVAVYLVPRTPLDVQMGLLLIFTAWPSAVYGDALLVFVAMVLFVEGYAAWHLDRAGRLLGLWGHALWHVLTAAAIVTMYLARAV